MNTALGAAGASANFIPPDDRGLSASGSEQYVFPCSDGSFCCEASTPFTGSQTSQSADCCSQNQGFFIHDNGTVTRQNPNGTNNTSNVSNSSTTANQTTTSISSKNHTGAIAGGVVGAVAALAILAAIVFFFLRRRQNSKPHEQHPMLVFPPDEESRLVGEMQGHRLSEVENTAIDNKFEKDGASMVTVRSEMDGAQTREEQKGPYEMS